MSEAEAPFVSHHAAVRVKNSIVVFGGETVSLEKRCTIWIYNLYTDRWRRYMIANNKLPPNTFPDCVVAIGTDIYIYYSALTNMTKPSKWQPNTLAMLSISEKTSFVWNEIQIKDITKTPSMRTDYSGWNYKDKLWIFGGFGVSPVGYLNHHGEFAALFWNTIDLHVGSNNQVLYFDPVLYEWTNPACFGTVPSPRRFHSSSIVGDIVWLHGGMQNTNIQIYDDLYQLDMLSLVWTQIGTNTLKPSARWRSTLTAITEKQLLLHRGFASRDKRISDSWIFDIPSQTWRQYQGIEDHPRHRHTGTTGLNSSVVIIGGSNPDRDLARWTVTDNERRAYSRVVLVKLEPKSLQQLAMNAIYQAKLPLETLPKTLTYAIMGTEVISTVDNLTVDEDVPKIPIRHSNRNIKRTERLTEQE